MISHTGNLRPGFAALLPGWTIDDRPALGARLARLAEFVAGHGGVDAMTIDEKLQFMWMEAHEARLPMPRPATEPVRDSYAPHASLRGEEAAPGSLREPAGEPDPWGEDWRAQMERRP